MGDRGMKEPGAGVRAVCGAVGACLAGRIVASVGMSHSPREDYPRCSVGWCAMQAGPELGGMGGRYASSAQFSSVQFGNASCLSAPFGWRPTGSAEVDDEVWRSRVVRLI